MSKWQLAWRALPSVCECDKCCKKAISRLEKHCSPFTTHDTVVKTTTRFIYLLFYFETALFVLPPIYDQSNLLLSNWDIFVPRRFRPLSVCVTLSYVGLSSLKQPYMLTDIYIHVIYRLCLSTVCVKLYISEWSWAVILYSSTLLASTQSEETSWSLWRNWTLKTWNILNPSK